MTISAQSATVLLTIFNNYPKLRGRRRGFDNSGRSSNYYRENLNKPKLNKESNELLMFYFLEENSANVYAAQLGRVE